MVPIAARSRRLHILAQFVAVAAKLVGVDIDRRPSFFEIDRRDRRRFDFGEFASLVGGAAVRHECTFLSFVSLLWCGDRWSFRWLLHAGR